MKNLQEFLREAETSNRYRAHNSIKKGIELNFERFCNTYRLDRFERLVVMLLFVNSTCMEFRKMFNEYRLKGQKSENGEMTMGEILSLISSDYRLQLQNRHYFSIHGTLIREEILPQYTYNSMVNILDLYMYLHERAIRFIIGDNNTYNVSLECVSRERPTIKLERVILPEKLKQDVVTLAGNYARQMAEKDKPGLKEFFGYGTGLVFSGKVGHEAALEKARTEYEKFRKRILEEPSHVEQHFIEAVKEVEKLEKGKPRKK